MDDILKTIQEKITKYKEKLNITEYFEVKRHDRVYIYVECNELNFKEELWCYYYFKDDKLKKDTVVNSMASRDVRNIMEKIMKLKIKMVED